MDHSRGGVRQQGVVSEVRWRSRRVLDGAIVPRDLGEFDDADAELNWTFTPRGVARGDAASILSSARVFAGGKVAEHYDDERLSEIGADFVATWYMRDGEAGAPYDEVREAFGSFCDQVGVNRAETGRVWPYVAQAFGFPPYDTLQNLPSADDPHAVEAGRFLIWHHDSGGGDLMDRFAEWSYRRNMPPSYAVAVWQILIRTLLFEDGAGMEWAREVAPTTDELLASIERGSDSEPPF